MGRMGKKNDKRLCWNCDGTVPFDLSSCPYCGVNLEPFHASSFEAALKTKALSESPVAGALAQPVALQKEPVPVPQDGRRESKALILLIPGATLALFGLILLLFAKNGTLTLSWKSNFAYLYLLGGAPLLYLGWRSLKSSESDR